MKASTVKPFIPPWLKKEALCSKLASEVAGSFGLKVFHTLISFFISVFLARALAPDGYGIYAFAFSVVSLLAVPVQMGLPMLLLREVAGYLYSKHWGLMRGLLIRSNQGVLFLSLILAAGVCFYLWVRSSDTELALQLTLLWGLVLLPLVALNRLREAALQGLGRVVAGQVPDKVALPVVFLGILWSVSLSLDLTPPLAMFLYCIAAIVAFMIGAGFLLQALPREVHAATPQHDTKKWIRSVLPLSLLAGLQVINSQVDVFMLGLLAENEDVGIYRVAFSCAALVIFTLTAVNAVISPYIVRMYRSGDKEALQGLIAKLSRLALLTGLMVTGVFVGFGALLLRVVFGEGYSAAYPVVVILCGGQIINAAFGLTSLLLTMTGHEREGVKILIVSLIVNILMNAILIPAFSSVGAAVSTIISITVWRLGLAIVVKRRLGLHSLPFYIRNKVA